MCLREKASSHLPETNIVKVQNVESWRWPGMVQIRNLKFQKYVLHFFQLLISELKWTFSVFSIIPFRCCSKCLI